MRASHVVRAEMARDEMADDVYRELLALALADAGRGSVGARRVA